MSASKNILTELNKITEHLQTGGDGIMILSLLVFDIVLEMDLCH